ncbi:DUF4386 family protein [Protaetiibacter intestinalis]|uniref:DUF4386 family protein n=1 Tax=Protaetiibacter intestinalis TaxID=2419774 RepID=A0A387B5F6_9MICO|nr:DUF4386 family protein [Protaetiibacter intestinalis]AYF98934.1 DUF4386 family protein [Protaetiibacter intestinalis]
MLPALLIAIPLAFNLAYGLLAWRFSYPGILREPTEVILGRFRAGGSGLVLLWWFFALTAIAFLPIPVLAAALVADPSLAALGLVVGVLAALVQGLGLLRWVFLVPHLARESAAGADPRTVDLVFQSFHRYLGVAVGEHLGYLFTGLWTILLAIGAAGALPLWSVIAGVVIGTMLLVGALEFVGPFEPRGWTVAGILVPVGYILWSAWLIALGVLLLV